MQWNLALKHNQRFLMLNNITKKNSRTIEGQYDAKLLQVLIYQAMIGQF